MSPDHKNRPETARSDHPAEPWRELPAAVADAIEPEVPALTGEILATIGREVPEYARPLEGSFGRGLRVGVTEALSQFLALIRDPDAGRGGGREVYVELGRGELRQGRSLDSLQSAYRVGARVAWRRMARAGRGAGLDPEVLHLLAEALFAYIDELSADSVEGYAEAQSALEGERELRRRRLLTVLVAEPAAEPGAIHAAAAEAGWTVPRSAAALAIPIDSVGRVAPGLPPGSIASSVDGAGCAIVPDPLGPGQSERLARAVRRRPAALGPAGPPPELPTSWATARAALGAIEAGALPGDALLHADRHLIELILYENRRRLERLAARRLAVFADLTARARERMTETLSAYLRHRGAPAAMAAEMNVHPQTARYRLARLRDLIGDQLEDPDARFELEAALRADAL